MNAPPPVIGIDLGTTNTVVGAVRDGQASALADEDGEVLIPSVVSFHPNGSVLVGRRAKERRLVDAANTIYSVKRLIGRSWDSEAVRQARRRFPFKMSEGPGQAALVVARGETYTLPEISAFVLRKAKSVAEAALGQALERAVITVPANFNDLQRAATKVAGRVAGLEVMRILNEPTAAALAYGYGRQSSERIAVYDFGGGTFDVTLLDLADNVFEVLATAGNTFLGGDDIDWAIAERMAETFLKQHRYDPHADPQVFESFKLAAEQLKHRLTSEPEASIDLTEVAHAQGGRALNFTFALTRAELDEMAVPILDRTFEVCREAFAIARREPSDFDQVLLVGGSTRMPLVRERVEQFFGRAVQAHISPDEVVAIGAAIQAAALSSVERRRTTAPPLSESARPRFDTVPEIPNTQPFSGARQRAATAPGVGPTAVAGAGSALRPESPTLVAAPTERHDPAFGVLGGPATAGQRSATLTGLGARGRIKTGPGLGPAAQTARSAGPTLVSASEDALRAQGALENEVEQSARTAAHANEIGGPTAADLPLITPDDDAEEPTLVLPDLAAQMHAESAGLASGTTETSVTYPIGDADLEEMQAWEAPAPADAPGRRPQTLPSNTAKLRPPTPPPPVPPPPIPTPPPRAFEVAPSPFGAPHQFGAVAPQFATAPAPPPALEHARPAMAPLDVSRAALDPPLLVDVTPLTLSVETVNGFCDGIIARNTPVPCERRRDFVTAADAQTSVRVRVSQGESQRFGENTLLGEIELSGLRPAPRGEVKISVTFALDTDGILQVSAKELATGRATSTEVRLVGLPNTADIARMAARHAAQNPT